MNTLKTFLLLTLLSFSLLLPAQQWRQVYENDAEGVRISGNKADLLEAINSGSEVRIGWQTQKEGKDGFVKHFATATLVDVLNEDEVFAQVSIAREQYYRKRKEVMGLRHSRTTYLLSTTDTHSVAMPGVSVPSAAPVPSSISKIKDLVSVRWFVR